MSAPYDGSMSAGPLPVGPEPAPDRWPDSPFTYVVGFNPMPMANAVATLGSTLRRSILWTLLGAVVWTAIWWTQRDSWGTPWLLVAGYGVSLVLILVTLARLLVARRKLYRIGSGPAIEASQYGLRLHTLEGAVLELAWQQVSALRTAGLKVGSGPELVVEALQGKVWSMPLSFFDALPGTIDSGLRATSGGRFGLDMSGLYALF